MEYPYYNTWCQIYTLVFHFRCLRIWQPWLKYFFNINVLQYISNIFLLILMSFWKHVVYNFKYMLHCYFLSLWRWWYPWLKYFLIYVIVNIFMIYHYWYSFPTTCLKKENFYQMASTLQRNIYWQRIFLISIHFDCGEYNPTLFVSFLFMLLRT